MPSVCPELDDGATEWGGRPVARQVAAAGPRQRAVLEGTVKEVGARKGPTPAETGRHSLLAEPAGSWFEAVLDDGSGRVTLRWTGRVGIPGIQPGVSVRIRGAVLTDGERLVILNPIYEFC